MSRIAIVLSVLIAGHAVAQSATNKVTVLPPIQVYASRIVDGAETVPASAMVIKSEGISRSGAANLPELLLKCANLPIREIGENPLLSQISMRGFGENSFGRVKVLVDGHDLGEVDMESPNLAQVPLEAVSRIEILPGASSVLHGDGAEAGVINVVTDFGDYDPHTRLSVKAGSDGLAGASVMRKGGDEESGTSYSACGRYLRSDGWRDASAYDMSSLGGSLFWDFANGARIGTRVSVFAAEYELPGSLSWQQWNDNPRQATKHDDWCRLWNYNLDFFAVLPIADNRWLSADWHFTQRHRHSHWGATQYYQATSQDYELFSHQVNLRYVDERSWWGMENRLTLGYDFKHDHYDDGDRFFRSRHAGYLYDEMTLAEGLSAVWGGRAELIGNRRHTDARSVEHRSHDLMADFELGLVYRPCNGIKTYVKGSRYHRSAFCDETIYTEDGEFLEPETGSSLDLGFEYALTEELRFEGSVYWSVLEDEIFYNPHAKEYVRGTWGGYNCNSPSKTERLGGDVGIIWHRDKVVELLVRYGYVNAVFDGGQYDGESIPLVSESRLRISAEYWLWSELSLRGGVTCMSAQRLMGDFDNIQNRLPGRTTFDMGLRYEPKWAKGWCASISVENLFDCEYCDYAGWSEYSGSYFYPATGRTFAITLEYEF